MDRHHARRAAPERPARRDPASTSAPSGPSDSRRATARRVAGAVGLALLALITVWTVRAVAATEAVGGATDLELYARGGFCALVTVGAVLCADILARADD